MCGIEIPVPLGTTEAYKRMVCIPNLLPTVIAQNVAGAPQSLAIRLQRKPRIITTSHTSNMQSSVHKLFCIICTLRPILSFTSMTIGPCSGSRTTVLVCEDGFRARSTGQTRFLSFSIVSPTTLRIPHCLLTSSGETKKPLSSANGIQRFLHHAQQDLLDP